MTSIRYDRAADGIITLTIDAPGQSANTMNRQFRTDFHDAVTRLKDEAATITGVILTSAKSTFFAGGDLHEIHAFGPSSHEQIFDMLEKVIKPDLRSLETLGKPVVAALNGAALGGGLELALACHFRIAVDDPKAKFGLPEVTLGLLPGAGGVVRTVRLLGLEKAFPVLTEGKQYEVQEALAVGLIHEVVPTRESMLARAREWIEHHPQSQQPWDHKDYRIPGGTANTPGLAGMLAVGPALLRAKTKGLYPAPEAIFSAAVESTLVDFVTATRIESRYFTQLATGQIAKNIVGTMWFQHNALKAGQSRPAGVPKSEFARVGILGAGMMGAGIAYACAIRGVPVILKDVSLAAAEKGKGHAASILTKRVTQGRLTSAEKERILALITPTEAVATLKECDLIIEAVFEDRELKNRVIRETEAMLDPRAVFASNTSTLPISSLAAVATRPEQFIGLHFFSPVDKMGLVEIIMGKATNAETLARAFDFVLKINKTPIVVSDSRGFYTSRVFGAFTTEGIALLAEGQNPASIEAAAAFGGMPVGPLAVADEVSLTLLAKVRAAEEADCAVEHKQAPDHAAFPLVQAMLTRHDRPGRAKGRGFYDYPPDGKKSLWPGLKEFAKGQATLPFDDLRDRMLYIQVIETVRCLEERVLRTTAEANIGSILGLGFAPWSGGTLQFINHFGPRAVAARAKDLATRYGPRFAPPQLLLEHAEHGRPFVDESAK